ncbi:MAG: bifunctional phosphopantothenoylcysteine decarboxylase/phosphopantothenate--cysteine ligase CoaBC [Actinobacteria bacterium]|nr:bifunctional phosphopantothenoylcysteine decarboxylase/phosphopantothenate--cysteine ligase CoaBC [Actinomycetota bacterium]
MTGARVVLGVSGGIAAYKAAILARLFVKAGATVDTILTRGATHFVGAATFEGITGRPVRTEVWDDVDQAPHVHLGQDADVIVVMPATAHVIGKLAHGLADDLLTNVVLVARCPVVVAPAMHTEMWDHPATRANAKTLRERGLVLVGPAEGELMGGDVGAGRVVEPEHLLEVIVTELGRRSDLAGRRVVVTAGGTREPLDPVRFLGNRSSGKMGFAIAAEAARRGAEVHLVAGPTHLATPSGVQRHDVVTAVEMQKAVIDLAPTADVIVKAAAVADFRPSETSATKLKKDSGPPALELVRNPDILAELGADHVAGRPPLLVGFAAETHDVEAHARAKLERKNADLLVVNDVSRRDAGFEVDTNEVFVLDRDGGRHDLARASKSAVAGQLWDLVVTRLG